MNKIVRGMIAGVIVVFAISLGLYYFAGDGSKNARILKAFPDPVAPSVDDPLPVSGPRRVGDHIVLKVASTTTPEVVCEDILEHDKTYRFEGYTIYGYVFEGAATECTVNDGSTSNLVEIESR